MKKLSPAIILCTTIVLIASISFYSCKDQSNKSSALVQGATNITRAVKGDSVWVLINHVKPGKEAEFEHFVHDIFWDGSTRLISSDQKVFRQTRVLHPTKKEADGSTRYIFIMDPVIPGADYDIESLMKKIYGEPKASEYMKMWADATTGQDEYYMVQSRH